MNEKTKEKISSLWNEYSANKTKKESFNFGWNEVNAFLYKVCESDLKGCKPETIACRLILIGRTYSAALERNNKHLDLSTDDIYSQVSNLKIWKETAKRLKTLKPDDYAEMISIHDDLVKALEGIVENKKISLVSKFLHFHRKDCFYIYDSQAREASLYLMPDRLRLPINSQVLYSDEYARFCHRVDCIRKEINPKLTLREIDDFLLYVYSKKIKSKK